MVEYGNQSWISDPGCLENTSQNLVVITWGAPDSMIHPSQVVPDPCNAHNKVLPTTNSNNVFLNLPKFSLYMWPTENKERLFLSLKK